MIRIQSISQIIMPFIACLVLLSSLSYSIDFHYCQGDLKSVSFFGKAKNCHELAEKMTSCSHHKNVGKADIICSEDLKNCCNNETLLIEFYLIKDILKFKKLDNFKSALLTALSFSLTDKWTLALDDIIPHDRYKPPSIIKDIPVLFESFLI